MFQRPRKDEPSCASYSGRRAEQVRRPFWLPPIIRIGRYIPRDIARSRRSAHHGSHVCETRYSIGKIPLPTVSADWLLYPTPSDRENRTMMTRRLLLTGAAAGL